ncbi:efflux RND transporter periplasmic adaptor subunit [Aliiglaciecola sp. CAU 1673]|uniref:efflux RND transporter periplasmic adaptor subunit n=1 Tax=Aliiglaciecola sp. CAU 1673 TaxID=3032595 RepID=UPI0023DA8055|nr:efflux RND transporter periplasmic adaptor subunit [Aliiglaciecola sp. CAU 1673]MDF2178184.1 efflux RND transporter periplasmic adaptor subunit [Aliiglaciecola sp. CAU 1673]
MRAQIISSLLLLTSISSMAQSAEPPAGPPPSPVRVGEVEMQEFIPTVDMVGSIYSQRNVQLTAGVQGRLDWVAEPGTFLHQGETVAKVDDIPLTLQQAEQQAQIKRASINLKYLERELQRLKELRQSNSASAFQLDQTQSQYDLAQADLEIAKLKLAQIEDQLSRTKVLAPFDGVITERQREAGGDVNRGENLVTMLDTENLEGRIYVPVKYLPFIRQGKEILVKANGLQSYATVKAIIPAADMRSQSFELRVSLSADSLSQWTAGQLVTASLPIQDAKQVLTVHRDALILRRDGTYVVVIDKENRARREKVQVGDGHLDRVGVSAQSLKAGDRVATRGAERLQDGQLVSIHSG